MPSVPQQGCDRAGTRMECPAVFFLQPKADGTTDEVSCCVRFTERPVSTWATRREGLWFCQQLGLLQQHQAWHGPQPMRMSKMPGAAVLQTRPTAGDALKRHQVSQTTGLCKQCWDLHSHRAVQSGQTAANTSAPEHTRPGSKAAVTQLRCRWDPTELLEDLSAQVAPPKHI